jgi:hypothetical protein
MDKTTEELLAATGIADRTLDWLDGMAIAAMDIGYQLATEDKKPDEQRETFQGDPLRPFKEPLIRYIASLEHVAKEHGVDPTMFLPEPTLVQMMPASNLIS